MCKTFVEKYNIMSDEELITCIRENDQFAFESLFNRYLPLIKHIISKNFYFGSDFDDMLQDATISFYYSVQMFDFKSASFATFLSVCIDRSLKSTIRKATAKKRIPKELIVSIGDGYDIDSQVISAEEEFFVKADSVMSVDLLKSKLSKLEFNVLKSFLNTGSYDKTAEELGLAKKSVDNALVRIRKKFN